MSSPLGGPPSPGLPCSILHTEGLPQRSALWYLSQAGFSLPWSLPVAGEALSPPAWFLLFPALYPFRIC